EHPLVSAYRGSLEQVHEVGFLIVVPLPAPDRLSQVEGRLFQGETGGLLSLRASTHAIRDHRQEGGPAVNGTGERVCRQGGGVHLQPPLERSQNELVLVRLADIARVSEPENVELVIARLPWLQSLGSAGLVLDAAHVTR